MFHEWDKQGLSKGSLETKYCQQIVRGTMLYNVNEGHTSEVSEIIYLNEEIGSM